MRLSKRICKQCGKEFLLSDSEIDFYKNKNLELPKRCSKCRQENKNNGNNSSSIKGNNNADSYKNKTEVSKTNISTSNTSNNNGNKKPMRNVLLALAVIAVLFVGKIFGVSFEDINPWLSSESNQSGEYLEFRNDQYWEDHFTKHKSEFDYDTKEEYLDGANAVINSSSSLYKLEKEEGDEVYYDADKNEIVFVSTDGYIRTYFKPSDGINYFNRQ